MAKYLIIEGIVAVGRFEKWQDRDKAFEEYFLKGNRSGYKKEASQ